MPKRIHRRRDADPREGLAKYGKATFADPVNKKYPIDTPGRIKLPGPTSTSPRTPRSTAPPNSAHSKAGSGQRQRLGRWRYRNRMSLWN
jgi:hypothetical protein